MTVAAKTFSGRRLAWVNCMSQMHLSAPVLRMQTHFDSSNSHISLYGLAGVWPRRHWKALRVIRAWGYEARERVPAEGTHTHVSECCSTAARPRHTTNISQHPAHRTLAVRVGAMHVAWSHASAKDWFAGGAGRLIQRRYPV